MASYSTKPMGYNSACIYSMYRRIVPNLTVQLIKINAKTNKE